MYCFVEAKTPKASSRGGRQTLVFSIRTSEFPPPRPTTKLRDRRGKRRRRDKRRVRSDFGEWGAFFIGTRTGCITGGAARSTARAVRVLVRARTPDAPRVPHALAPTRTPAQCSHGRTRVPTRTRGHKRWRREQHDGRCTRLGSSRQQLLISPMPVFIFDYSNLNIPPAIMYTLLLIWTEMPQSRSTLSRIWCNIAGSLTSAQANSSNPTYKYLNQFEIFSRNSNFLFKILHQIQYSFYLFSCLNWLTRTNSILIK